MKISNLYLGRMLGYGSRHGPSARGKPVVRGKPSFVYIRGKPLLCVKRKSRDLAAKNTAVEFGVFIPNRDCIAKTEAENSLWLTVVKEKRINHGEHKGKTEEHKDEEKEKKLSACSVCSVVINDLTTEKHKVITEKHRGMN